MDAFARFLVPLILVVVPGFQAWGQCSLLEDNHLRRLSRMSMERKSKFLFKQQFQLVTTRRDAEGCKYQTYVRCKNYIDDQHWHWAEIITINSCDQVVSYSTSMGDLFHELTTEFLSKYHQIDSRSYDGLDFEVFQDRRGKVVELNEHPSAEGLTFYLMNILRE